MLGLGPWGGKEDSFASAAPSPNALPWGRLGPLDLLAREQGPRSRGVRVRRGNVAHPGATEQRGVPRVGAAQGIVSAARAAPLAARGRREPRRSLHRRHARRPALTCQVPRPAGSPSHLTTQRRAHPAPTASPFLAWSLASLPFHSATPSLPPRPAKRVSARQARPRDQMIEGGRENNVPRRSGREQRPLPV